MRKGTKKWLIAAASLVGIGLIVFAAAMTACHWDFSRLSTDRFETNTHEIREAFDSINLNTETADVFFRVSEDDTCSVICYEPENMRHAVRVQEGTLTVREEDNRKWYDHIGIHFHSPRITVCLPAAEYASLVIRESTGNIEIPKELKFDRADIACSTGDVRFFASDAESVKIKTSTGDIRVEKLSAGTLELSVSTGDVRVQDVMCRKLISNGSTGNLSLKNVIAAEKLSVERSTGNVRLDRSDAAEIFIKTGTGDVTGSVLSEKVFLTETSVGRISVPKTAAGGKCEIITSTGDIIIKID